MSMFRCSTACLAGLTVALLATEVAAEGSAELLNANNVYQTLANDTVLYVDVLNFANETIRWSGTGSVTISDSNGNVVATLSSGQSYAPTKNDEFEVTVAQDQLGDWDLGVFSGNTEQLGRLHSYNWSFNAQSYAASAGLDVSFYAVVPGGNATETGVVEMRFDGLAGFEFNLFGNSTGIPGFERRSVNDVLVTTAIPVEFPLYLSLPDNATYSHIQPSINSFSFEGSGGLGCDSIASGVSTGEFIVDSSTDGVAEVICDIDGDGQYENNGDLVLVGQVTAGQNSLVWNGLVNGVAVPAGNYTCRARVTVGELHYVAVDIETAFQGLRLYEVESNGDKTPLRMFWNDVGVSGSRLMPNGETSADSSPFSGLNSGAYSSPFNAYSVQDTSGNSRAWGNNVATGVGNDALLDTFTYLAVSSSANVTFDALSPTLDTDGDGALDIAEICRFGTDENDPDTDDDFISDGEETDGGTQATDTDSDGTIDALDDDSDNDTILDRDEAGDQDLNTPARNSDGAGNPDYRDLDADDDGLPDRDEAGDSDPNTVPADINNDNEYDFQDPDLDDDTIIDGFDNCLLTPNTDQMDSDADGVGDACDDDADNDGIPDTNDNCPIIFNPNQADADGDGVGDRCDDDDDNDGILDRDDNCPFTPNPNQEDADGDGIGDACENDRDGDGVTDSSDNCPDTPNPGQADADSDGVGDACDDDRDNDGIADQDDNCPDIRNPNQADIDNDGLGDVCDDDSDNDGAPDPTDNCPNTPNPDQIDTDGDGIGDACDTNMDSDGDGIDDGIDNCVDIPNTDQSDVDGDGQGDVCDDDADGDGIPNDVEGDEDPDGDGTPNWLDLDSDDDNISDRDETDDGALVDTDGDETPDFLDRDTDDDGIDDIDEAGDVDLDTPPIDTDGNGIPDFRQPADDDNNGTGENNGTNNDPGTNNGTGGELPDSPLQDDGHIELGGGCSTPGGDLPGGLLLLFAVGAFIAGRRRRWTGVPFLSAALLTVSSAAFAQSTEFQLQQFEPVPSQSKNTLNVSRSDVLDHLTPSVGLMLHFADDPLVAYRVLDGERTLESRVVDDQLMGEITAALGLFDALELGLVLPLALYQSGEDDTVTADIDGFALADPRIIPKVRVLNPERFGGLGLGLSAPVYLPLGSSDRFVSDGKVRVEPRLALDFRIARFIAAANVAYQARPETVALNYVADDMLRWGLGLEHGVGPQWLSLVGTLFGSYTLAEGRNPRNLDEVANNAAARPMEALAGFKFHFMSGITAQLGGGLGLTKSVGAPDFRLFGGIDWSPVDGDRDGDGIMDSVDGCPDDPEDFDDFEDTDGCPDLDNDGDGILDTDDQCPMEPEDVDGFEDENGCPDPDNDQDSILDVDDECPLVKGIAEFNGCPDTDGDGIPDSKDECPKEPEDVDGFEDEDGCPDPDNDKDGILDINDQCPDEAEVINGNEDEDGCPDEGASKVRVTEEKIEILEKVFFDYDKATIQGRSFDVLNQVGSVLKANPQILKIRIEGHTDSKGSDDYNKELSQKRAEAVKAYLVARGVDEGRLVPVGYGEEKPIEDNSTKAGRSINRRVEFTIIER